MHGTVHDVEVTEDIMKGKEGKGWKGRKEIAERSKRTRTQMRFVA